MEKVRVNFADFEKIDIRLGKVEEVEKVSGSNKLLRLQVNLGVEKRQSIAGLGENYGAEDLKGRMVAVVTNLVPRKILGMDSEVMLLAAFDNSGELALLNPDKEMKPGIKVG